MPVEITCYGAVKEIGGNKILWEIEVRETWAGRLVGPEIISRTPGAFILADSLWDLNDLPDLQNIARGAYLFSNSRAYDDEQAADLDRLSAWMNWMGLDLFGDPDDPNAVRLHASGHANGSRLVNLVRSVQPGVLIPVHTQDPRWWQAALQGSNIRLRAPTLGKAIQL
jgi:ribonuclease J